MKTVITLILLCTLLAGLITGSPGDISAKSDGSADRDAPSEFPPAS